MCQKKYSISFTTENYKKVKKNIQLSFKDSISALNYLQELQYIAISKGYLTASIDTLRFERNKIITSFFIGERFEKIELNIKPEDIIFLKRNSSLSEKAIASIPFRPVELSKTLKSIHNSTTSNGYPFSKVYLTDINFSDSELKANLTIIKGDFYIFSKINVKGDSSISTIFISSLIDIKEGECFDESKLKSISKTIKQLSFIREIKPHELLFTKDGVELFLYLESIPVSAINGAIGLQPKDNTTKVGLAGELNLKLLNVFKHGESVNLNWRSIQEQTQSLNAKINYPFLFQTPFGIDSQFQLYKRDTSFLELKSTFGIQYFLKGGNYLKVFYQNSSSNILNGGANNPNFTNLSTVKSNAYGITLFRKQLDYIPNPSKGFGLVLEVAIGSRKSQLSDTSNITKSTTYRSALQIDWFIPLTPRHVIHLINSTEMYYAPVIFQNEVYRFGGQTSLRGFNEEELYATLRSVFSIEYRYLLDQNSHIFAFFDQGLYENNATSYNKDSPFGFGAGLSFGTNIGIFSISYALGKQLSNPILMRNGKVHFGYIAYF
jgi:outer membrane protein assembly factor BamA